jgi:hypothetical protein
MVIDGENRKYLERKTWITLGLNPHLHGDGFCNGGAVFSVR